MSSGLLTKSAKGLAGMAAKRVLSSATDKLGGTAERLTDYVSGGGGGSGLLSAITGGGGKGGGGKGKSLKVTNIVEHIDVGVPIRLAYNQWTQFADFPSFMKKVESVEQESDEKLNWKAQVFWSHRTWQSTIIEQVPDRHIIWRSDGAKGTVDGTVSFHELAPELTRIIVNLQYHPQGLMERTGNLWRAQGRRARLEIKHFARYVMNEAVLKADEIEGWRGEIHEEQVTKDNEQAKSEEEQAAQEQEQRDSQEPGEDEEKAGRPQQRQRDGGGSEDEQPRESRRGERAPRSDGPRSTRSRQESGDGGRRSRRSSERLAS
jgi:uncharacterized membrane protein